MVNTYCKQRVANFLQGRQAFIFLALIIFSMSGQLFSQQITVRGTVVAEAENETLIGVNILEKNGKALAATDIDGKYSLNANAGDAADNAFTLNWRCGTAEQGTVVPMNAVKLIDQNPSPAPDRYVVNVLFDLAID